MPASRLNDRANEDLTDGWALSTGRCESVAGPRRLVASSITVEAVAELVASPEPEWDPVGLDLERALAALPKREQEVVRGLTVQGRTVRELASALGMKEATLRVALHRGLKRLALAARRELS